MSDLWDMINALKSSRVGQDVGAFATGGLTGLAKQEGYQLPAWSDKIGQLTQGLGQAASYGMPELGAAWPGSKVASFRQMLSQGTPIEEIASNFGITVGAAKAMAKRGGVPIAGVTDIWSTPGAMDKMREMIAQGKGYADVARELGFSPTSVIKKAKLEGLEPIPQEQIGSIIKKQRPIE